MNLSDFGTETVPTKKCPRCKQIKSLSEYNIRKKNGYALEHCKLCKSEIAKKRKERYKNTLKIYCEKNKEK